MIKKIEVTEYHIKNGVKRSMNGCPISLALTPHLPAGVAADVGACWFSRKDIGFSHDLPHSAIDFIKKFDQGHAVAPFVFELEIG